MNKTGFGFLRLPRLDETDEKSVNDDVLNVMVDRFLELGGNYFDTAYTYQGGVSEEALRKSLVERYPRDRFRIADKLPGFAVKTAADNERFFAESCRRCGVDFFDVYLIHGLNEENYELAKKFRQFEFLSRLKAEGKAKRIGFSFHDTADLLDTILTEHAEVDVVLLQINYLDWDSYSIQSRLCYETAVRHGKTVLVMEPVKGGTLANVPESVGNLLESRCPGDSAAHWAIRFATGLEQVEIVLSGMNTMEQMEDNLRPMMPLDDGEYALLEQAAHILRSEIAIACTACGYCTAGCPKNIAIPRYFALYNECKRNPGEVWKAENIFDSLKRRGGSPSDCIGCGQCEQHCPQRLRIMESLKDVAKIFANG